MTSADSIQAQKLDALHMPLHGRQVIEASAGTGKTWTLAALYLRLVLGHQRQGVILRACCLVAGARELTARQHHVS